jgi:hypothetical protein
MLGRLKMSVDECISAYIELMKTIFEDKLNSLPVGRTGKIKSRFDQGKLKGAAGMSDAPRYSTFPQRTRSSRLLISSGMLAADRRLL